MIYRANMTELFTYLSLFIIIHILYIGDARVLGGQRNAVTVGLCVQRDDEARAGEPAVHAHLRALRVARRANEVSRRLTYRAGDGDEQA